MKMFISHIHEEASFARILKDWLESSFLGLSVFVSSDEEDIKLGDKWLDRIDIALGETDVLIILYSPVSSARPWINFEAGCGWIKKVPIIPVCHSGLTASDLKPPLFMFQGVTVDDDFPQKIISEIGNVLGVKRLPKLDYNAFGEEIREALEGISKDHIEVQVAIPNTNGDDYLLVPEISSAQVDILRAVSDRNGAMYIDVRYLEWVTELSKLVVEYHVDQLLAKKMINRHVKTQEPTTYSLTAKGRAYLVENNLVE